MRVAKDGRPTWVTGSNLCWRICTIPPLNLLNLGMQPLLDFVSRSASHKPGKMQSAKFFDFLGFLGFLGFLDFLGFLGFLAFLCFLSFLGFSVFLVFSVFMLYFLGFFTFIFLNFVGFINFFSFPDFSVSLFLGLSFCFMVEETFFCYFHFKMNGTAIKILTNSGLNNKRGESIEELESEIGERKRERMRE